MTPEQALSVLEQATGIALLTRDDHANVLLALGVLREGLKKEHDGGGASIDESEGRVVASSDGPKTEEVAEE